MTPRGVVQMMDSTSGLPVLSYLKRNDDILPGMEDQEWDWTPDKKEQFVFETHELALSAAALLQDRHREVAVSSGLNPLKLSVYAPVYGSDADRADRPERLSTHVVPPEEAAKIRRHVEKLESMGLF